MVGKFTGTEWIKENIRHHDAFANKYSEHHSEIYNDIEQNRIRNELSRCIESLNCNDDGIVSLDFGAGAGNLTNHLLCLGCNVISADVSSGCLELMKGKFHQFKDKLNVVQLNGTDLAGIEDRTYSPNKGLLSKSISYYT